MVKFMKKHKIYLLFIFAFIIPLCTCNDPVFFTISQEVKPIEPRIKGTPTNFVVYNGRMYVASGNTLYSYNKGTEKPYWSYETPPGGKILQLATTESAPSGKYLYALCSTDYDISGRTVIKYYDKNNSSWAQVSGIPDNYGRIHNIFEANCIIFFYATASTDRYDIFYTIFFIDSSGTVKRLFTQDPNDTGELCGAAWNGTSYFLLTKNRGVYKIDNLNTSTASLIESNINFTGIINLEDTNNTIFLIARDGDAYTVNNSIVTRSPFMNKLSTGALAIWRENDSSSEWLLLSGRQDSLRYTVSFGYTYGYLELAINTAGIAGGFAEPGRNLLSSVRQGGNPRYQSTLGKQPVNHLFQVPSTIDPNMTLFAATQKNGVWSYRERGSLYQWNAEGENEP